MFGKIVLFVLSKKKRERASRYLSTCSVTFFSFYTFFVCWRERRACVVVESWKAHLSSLPFPCCDDKFSSADNEVPPSLPPTSTSSLSSISLAEKNIKQPFTLRKTRTCTNILDLCALYPISVRLNWNNNK